MQITIRLDDEIYRQVKAAVAEQGVSLNRLVEEAIRDHLDNSVPSSRPRPLRLPVSSATGGLAPGFSNLQEAIEAADLRHTR